MEEANESIVTNDIGYSIATTAWFEFILDETLLERHLSDPNAGECRLTNIIESSVYGTGTRTGHAERR